MTDANSCKRRGVGKGKRGERTRIIRNVTLNFLKLPRRWAQWVSRLAYIISNGGLRAPARRRSTCFGRIRSINTAAALYRSGALPRSAYARERAPVSLRPLSSLARHLATLPRVPPTQPGHEPPIGTGTKPTTPAFNSKLGHSLLSFSRIPLQFTCPRYVNALIDSNQCGDLCCSWFFARDRIKRSLSLSLMVRNLPGMRGTPYPLPPLSPFSFMRYSARNAEEKKLNKLSVCLAEIDQRSR